MSSISTHWSSSHSTHSNKNVDEIFKQEISSSSEDPPMEERSSLILQIPPEHYKKSLFKQGLYDPGSGKICTKTITISDSDVYNHQYFKYPSVKNPGVEVALLEPEPKVLYDLDGQDLYLALCKDMKIIPVRKFHRDLLQDVMNMRYYGVNSIGVRPMCLALAQNRYVRKLDLTSNFLCEDACYHLGQLIADSATLKELILTGCRIQPGGLERLVVGLYQSDLEILDISRNDIRDAGFIYIAEQFTKGATLKRLNVSYNDLSQESALEFAAALQFNNILTHLDLSWNQFNAPKGSNALLNRLAESDLLVELNIAWNFLRTTTPLQKLLAVPTLRVLDLSNNRLTSESATVIASALTDAKKLEIIDLSHNPLSPSDALKILKKMRRRTVKVQQLLMEDIPVTAEFAQELKQIMTLKHRANAKVTHGWILRNYTLTLTDMREIVMRRMQYLATKAAKKKFRTDIAVYFLKKGKDLESLLPNEMLQDMKMLNLPIDEDLVNELGLAFPGPRISKKLRYISLIDVVDYVKRKWPDARAPPTPPISPPAPEGKAKNGKKGKGKKKK